MKYQVVSFIKIHPFVFKNMFFKGKKLHFWNQIQLNTKLKHKNC